MKKVIYFLLMTVATIAYTGCDDYDDEYLRGRVDDLEGRVSALETMLQSINNDIATLQTLVDALNQGKVITSAIQDNDGYTLTFSDGSTVVIKNGTNGADAPVIGVKADTDGVYYWTITSNGTTDWLTDDSGNKLRVTGESGTTPVIGIDDEGYWTVDTGSGAERIGGDNPVKATGTDGDSLFQSVTVNDDSVTFVLTDGTTFDIPMAGSFSVALEEENPTIKQGETKTFNLVFTNVEDCILVSVTDGWTALVEGTELTVTAPDTLTDKNSEGVIKLLIADSEGTCKIATLTITAEGDYTLRVLTFEDADYQGTGNYLGEMNWSSLIDYPQYGGTLLYGTSGMGPTDYSWYDENNTFLKHEFPTNWGTTCYMGGGHAISNYVDMDLNNGTYMYQLAVYYQDNSSKGGHNGSDNFCVHFGYVDNSGWSSDNLPYLYFGDGETRVIDHMYVMPTTYLVNSITNGKGLADPVSEENWVKLVAIGYDEGGFEVDNRAEIYLAGPDGNVTEWTKWDLSVLGKVLRVEFNVTGSNEDVLGVPGYFAYDDVAVRFE